MTNTKTGKETNVQGLSTSQILDKVNFDVVKEKIQTVSGTPIDNKYALVRTDKNIPLSVVSDRYRIINHAEAIAEPLAILNRQGFEVARFDSWKFGAFVSIQLRSTDTVNINGEVHKYTLTVVNSYDKTTPFKIALGLWRQICKNGMGVYTNNVSKSIIHVGDDQKILKLYKDITMEAVNIRGSIDGFKESMERLSDIKIGDEAHAQKILESRFKYSEGRIKAIVEAWKRPENGGGALNMYSLFQGLTYYFSRKSESEGASGQNLLNANKITKEAVGKLTILDGVK